MANKRIWLGILATALVFGMTVIGCNDGGTSDVETGGTLTVTNTTSDVYEYQFLNPSGRDLSWGDTLYGYRSVTLRGYEDGVYEFKFRKTETPRPSWVSKYGNLSGGKNAKMNIP